MATYSSKPVVVGSTPEAISDKFSDLTRFQEVIDSIPEEERRKVGEVTFKTDSIVLHTPQVGEITLKVTERKPNRVAMEAVGSPVPMILSLNLMPVNGGASTEMTTAMDVDIPVFLKPMIGGTMQKAVDQFAELMKRFA